IVVQASAAANITITLTPSTVTANGTDTFVASGRVTDAYGNVRAGDTVTITSSGDVVGTTAVTDSSGNYSATLTASTTADTETIKIGRASGRESANLTEVAGASTQFSVGSYPTPTTAC